MRPAGLVFDFDGVLANSEPLHFRAFRDVLATVGIDLTEQDYYAQYLGFDDVGAFEAALRAHGRNGGDAEVSRLIALKAEHMPALLSEPGVLMDGAATCISRFAGTWPLAIASGAWPAEIEIVLAANGLRGHFATIVGAGDTPRSKPYPDPYAQALANLAAAGHVPPGTAASRFVAVEDSRWGITSARQAGLRCIGLTSSYERSALGEADHVIDSLDELTPELLDEVVRRC